MIKEPYVTVIMATYNQATYLRQALDSLKQQSLPDRAFTVIVINDGSTDETADILTEYQSWSHIIERENKGLVTSCNEGLALVTTPFFVRLDSDDYVSPNWLLSLVHSMERHPQACCVYSDRYKVSEGIISHVRAQSDNLYSLEACGTLFNTQFVREAGGYRTFYWEEYDLYLRLQGRGTFIHVPCPLYYYRHHPNNMTHRRSARLAGWEELVEEWGYERLASAGYDPDLKQVLQANQSKTISSEE